MAGPPDLAGPVEAAGFRFWQFDPPPEDELGPIWGRVPELPPEEANEVVVRRDLRPPQHDGRAAATSGRVRGVATGRRAARPERVRLGPRGRAARHPARARGHRLASVEELGTGIAAGAVDSIRRAQGLAPDPGGDLLRRSPWLSTFPESLDEGAQPDTQRFRDPAWDQPAGELPDWWPGRESEPLVYVTFGSVAGSFPQALPVYDVAMRAVAELPVRVLLTVGRELDLDALPAAPDNVRVERWVPQQDVLGHAAAAVVHGGSGSTLGAIAAGVPLVVVPLFADQPQNARRVAEVGAGLAVEPDREDVGATAGPLRDAIESVLSEPSYGERARALADELRAEPPVDEAVPLFAESGRS